VRYKGRESFPITAAKGLSLHTPCNLHSGAIHDEFITAHHSGRQEGLLWMISPPPPSCWGEEKSSGWMWWTILSRMFPFADLNFDDYCWLCMSSDCEIQRRKQSPCVLALQAKICVQKKNWLSMITGHGWWTSKFIPSSIPNTVVYSSKRKQNFTMRPPCQQGTQRNGLSVRGPLSDPGTPTLQPAHWGGGGI